LGWRLALVVTQMRWQIARLKACTVRHGAH
jgi:hypothetical protein